MRTLFAQKMLRNLFRTNAAIYLIAPVATTVEYGNQLN